MYRQQKGSFARYYSRNSPQLRGELRVRAWAAAHLLSTRSVLLPTRTMMTSLPRSFRTSSIHRTVLRNDCLSAPADVRCQPHCHILPLRGCVDAKFVAEPYTDDNGACRATQSQQLAYFGTGDGKRRVPGTTFPWQWLLYAMVLMKYTENHDAAGIFLFLRW